MTIVSAPPKPGSATKKEELRFWQDVVEQYQSTRQGRIAFCKRLGIKSEELTHWLVRLRLKPAEQMGDVCDQEKTKKSSSFVPVKITPASRRIQTRAKSLQQTASLVLDFQNGLRLSLSNDFEESALTRVLDVMERRLC